MAPIVKRTLIVFSCSIGAIAGSVGGVQFGQWYHRATANPTSAARGLTPREQVILGFRTAADSEQSKLPEKIDNITELTAVVAQGTLLQYDFRIDAKLEDIDSKEFLTSIRENAKSFWCNENNAETINVGGIIRYYYVDNEGKLIGQMEINSCR